MASDGEEIVVALGIPGGFEGDGTKGAGAGGVGWSRVFKDLNVGPELELHLIIIGAGAASDKESGLRSSDTP